MIVAVPVVGSGLVGLGLGVGVAIVTGPLPFAEPVGVVDELPHRVEHVGADGGVTVGRRLRDLWRAQVDSALLERMASVGN